ncbi:hypothetical protein UFOVP27_137 [uncultured Caudovirales phage]|jgi:hypothetical protein|uniref:Uncharacterized protein n=1 Tax=uncultured Caudovirales phage TaxID=2100421 RepID=A0A6J5KM79_9CAUD|nr:hypothetical protein UFOVP27_137 [uncultured Caudovirales phage]
MKCYDCDGYGFLSTNEFRDWDSKEEVVGESADHIYSIDGASVAVCPYCDGKGKQSCLSMIIDAMVAAAS